MALALAALLGALLIQVGTNLANDYYDFHKGADTEERLGPVRVTQAGLVAPRTVLVAAFLCFGAAVVVGLLLVRAGGWPVVAIGLLSILAGWAYTGGPAPLGYLGLGEVFVLLFFGFAAVGGTVWVQALRLPPATWLSALSVGCTGVLLIAVNNLRDVETDRRAHKRTLAARFGVGFARAEYAAVLAVAFLAPVAAWALGQTGPQALLLSGGAAVGRPAAAPRPHGARRSAQPRPGREARGCNSRMGCCWPSACGGVATGEPPAQHAGLSPSTPRPVGHGARAESGGGGLASPRPRRPGRLRTRRGDGAAGVWHGDTRASGAGPGRLPVGPGPRKPLGGVCVRRLLVRTPAARAGVEMALLDWLARKRGVALGDFSAQAASSRCR